MRKTMILLYGLLSYAFFLVTFLYAIGFVGGHLVPKGIDDGPSTPLAHAIPINLALLTLFAVQHSVMARPGFKRWWLRFISPALERPTYVLLATSALALLLWQWRPLPETVWSVTNPAVAAALTVLSLLGWLIVLASTFLISHFELFGLKQVFFRFTGKSLPETGFKTPGLYKLVRHPLYLGFIIAFWATPQMSQGHLLFAVVTTAYIMVGIALEERDLIAMFGDDYRRYRERVAMLLPLGRMNTAPRHDLASNRVGDARQE
ncbi:methanethiol S-methyltransferase [Bosea sp. BH3]|uniref:methanethiol S-methyltransferase n=1 Tax=Bosea sp. BH3 TaxID=2871701 RepID=UPI0021CB5182|nr:methanethiol S-methyltransferase [Bosea sp. BH3]MCU4182185.1 isoprenylcysteine carboxylmethyltransferase family protein [Bosea sp. BH3]